MDNKWTGQGAALVLGVCAAAAATAGAAEVGRAAGWGGWALAACVSAGLHGAWLNSAGLHGGPRWNAGGAICWAICAWLAALGAAAWGAEAAVGVGLEVAPLLAAWASRAGGEHWVARWRRWQEATASELALCEGVVPWVRRCLKQAWRGTPGCAAMAATSHAAALFRRAAETADRSIVARIAGEEFQGLVRAALDGVAMHAATEYAAAGISCGRKAREAAMVLRDAVAKLPLAGEDQKRLAEWCEQALMAMTERNDGTERSRAA